jgi:hypothetical protein
MYCKWFGKARQPGQVENAFDRQDKWFLYTRTMNPQRNEGSELVRNSVLYKEFLAEREEILRHKWIESEKAGHDIGFERALLDWIVKYRSAWREERSRQQAKAG